MKNQHDELVKLRSTIDGAAPDPSHDGGLHQEVFNRIQPLYQRTLQEMLKCSYRAATGRHLSEEIHEFTFTGDATRPKAYRFVVEL
jgi:hypothetical protein